MLASLRGPVIFISPCVAISGYIVGYTRIRPDKLDASACNLALTRKGNWAIGRFSIFEALKGKLVVSCQAYPGDPLEDTDAIRRMAMAAIGAGASLFAGTRAFPLSESRNDMIRRVCALLRTSLRHPLWPRLTPQ